MNKFEEYFYQRNKLTQFTAVVLASKLNIPVDSRTRLTECLLELVRVKSRLRSNAWFDEETGKYQFKLIEDYSGLPIEFKHVEQFNDDLLVEEMDQLVSTWFKLDSNDFLWKLTVINDQYLIFTSDHLVVDGASCLHFHKHLVGLLNGHQPTPDSLDVRLRLEKLVKPSYSFFCKALWKEFVPVSVQKRVVSWLQAQSPYHSDELSNWVASTVTPSALRAQAKYVQRLISLDSGQFGRLQRRLRQEKVTLTAFLVYAAMLVLSRLSRGHNVEICVPVNLRSLVEGAQDQYGVHVTSIEFIREPMAGSRVDWDEVRALDMSEPVRRENAQLVGMLDYVNVHDVVARRMDRPRAKTLEVSNLGFCAPSGGHYDLDELFFTQALNPAGSYFTSNVVSTASKTSIVVTAFTDPQLPRTAFDAYCTGLHTLLHTYTA